MNKSLRIVFLGTPDFAVASLSKLYENQFNIVAVITAPDRKSGRGQKITASPVKVFAEEHQIPVLQPTNLKDESFLGELKGFKADLQIVVAFRMLPERVWNMPRLGTVNLHASLLPQYRGAAPINWVIINGEQKTGVTTFLLQHEIDTGNIIFSESVDIVPFETAGSLHDKLMAVGAGTLLKTVQSIELNEYPLTPQNQLIKESEIKQAPKIFKEDCRINWERSASQIYNHIRGLSPYPSAFTALVSPNKEHFVVKIFEVDLNEKSTNGISTDGKTFLRIGLPDGTINIKELQLAGKKRMGIEEFLRGFILNNSWNIV